MALLHHQLVCSKPWDVNIMQWILRRPGEGGAKLPVTKALAAADYSLLAPEGPLAPLVPKAQPPVAAKPAPVQVAPASLAAAAPAAMQPVPVAAAPKPVTAEPPVRTSPVQPAAVAVAAVASPLAVLSAEEALPAVGAPTTDASAAPVPADLTMWSKAVRA